MSPRVVLNIGWARAGSTAFRANFVARHPQIRAVDRAQPFSEGPGAGLLVYIKSASDEDFDRYADELKAEWDAYVAAQDEPVVCLTDEELSIGLPGSGVLPSTIAARCGRLFPGAGLLAVVRDQADIVRSFYGLAAQRGLTEGQPVSDFARRHFLAPGDESFTYLFDYAAALRAYRDWMPLEAMRILPYSRTDSAQTYAAAARALGLDEADWPATVVNASEHAGGRPGYEPGVEEAIRALYAPSNRVLARTFGVAFPALEPCG